MKFVILNVQHGFSAYAIAGDGRVLLFDCGYSSTCRPSNHLESEDISIIHRLFVTNYDEDHVADLPMLRQKFGIKILTRNTSVNSTQLRNLKEPPVTPAMNELLEMIDDFTGEVSSEQLKTVGIQVRTFFNTYPSFTDTNNLSLLIFLEIGSTFFALPGDLEDQGWRQLLQRSEVCELLERVDVFVASHHGRESGYCREVFDYCTPRLIVMSDGAIQYDTQRMASVYGQHATGDWFNHRQRGREWRKVLTTRNDGNIWWHFN